MKFLIMFLAILFMFFQYLSPIVSLALPRTYRAKSGGIVLRKTKEAGLAAFVGDGFYLSFKETSLQALKRAASEIWSGLKGLNFRDQSGSMNMDRQLWPHLQILPVVPRSQIMEVISKGGGFRKASSVQFKIGRQSRRDLIKQFDNGKLRDDDWNKKHLSSEPVDINSFPSYGASATRQLPLAGALPAGQEARELDIITTFTVKSNAGADATVRQDANTIAAAIYSKLRATIWAIADTYNLFPAESRTISVISSARDPLTEFMPVGSLIPASGASAVSYKIKMTIPFVHRNLEVPEIFSTTTDQINLSGSQINLDTNGAALTSVSLGAGPVASTIVVGDVRAQILLNAIPALHAGPPMFYRSRQVTQSTDTEPGQGVDLFCGSEETVAASVARVQNWSVARDSRWQPLNMAPDNLAAAYGGSTFTQDAILPLDITGTSYGAGTLGTQQGAQVVPIEWVDGRVRSSAWQWPMFTQSRQIRQNLNAGQSATFNLLFWQVRPITECTGQLIALAGAAGIAINSPDQLVVRGGNDGQVNKLFKGRFIKAAK